MKKDPYYKQDLFFILDRISRHTLFKARRFNPARVRDRPLITWRSLMIELPRKIKADKYKIKYNKRRINERV